MHEKIQDVPIMQKSQLIYPIVKIVKNPVCLIVYALTVVFMQTNKYMICKVHKLSIGVDLMAGEVKAFELLKATLVFAKTIPDVFFIFFGTKKIQNTFEEHKSDIPNVDFCLAKQSIEMDENPLHAIRMKRESSINLGLRYLKEKKTHAFISSGNTGALVSSAKMILSTPPHILRPALLALIPAKNKSLAVVDVGANVNCKKTHLLQFAHLGSDFQKKRGIKDPKVGLLNIGIETTKGTTLLQETYLELSKKEHHKNFSFIGNIEGKDAFNGKVDVLVTDGFTGNIFLKTAEGIADFLIEQFSLEKNCSEYPQYPGAILLGVNGLVIKCHGYCTTNAFVKAIKNAIDMLNFS